MVQWIFVTTSDCTQNASKCITIGKACSSSASYIGWDSQVNSFKLIDRSAGTTYKLSQSELCNVSIEMGHVRHVHYHENHDTNGIWNLSCKGPGQSDCMIWHVGEGRRREALFRIRETVFVFLCCCSAMNLEQGDQARSLLRSGGKRHPYWHFIAPCCSVLSPRKPEQRNHSAWLLSLAWWAWWAWLILGSGRLQPIGDLWMSQMITSPSITPEHPQKFHLHASVLVRHK